MRSRRTLTRKPPSLDELYYRLKEVESALGGLSSLLQAARPPHEDLADPVDLAGIGTLLDFSRDKIRRVAGQISEHALRGEQVKPKGVDRPVSL